MNTLRKKAGIRSDFRPTHSKWCDRIGFMVALIMKYQPPSSPVFRWSVFCNFTKEWSFSLMGNPSISTLLPKCSLKSEKITKCHCLQASFLGDPCCRWKYNSTDTQKLVVRTRDGSRAHIINVPKSEFWKCSQSAEYYDKEMRTKSERENI